MIIGLIVYAAILIALALWRPDEDSTSRDARDGFLTGLILVGIMAGGQQLLKRLGYAEYVRDSSVYVAVLALYLGAVALLPKRWMTTAFWRQAEKRNFLKAHSDFGKRLIIGGLFAVVGSVAFGYIVLQARAVHSCRAALASARSAADSSRVETLVTEASQKFARFALRQYQQDCHTVLAPDA